MKVPVPAALGVGDSAGAPVGWAVSPPVAVAVAVRAVLGVAVGVGDGLTLLPFANQTV